MEIHELALTAARAAVMYVALLVTVRLLGKRTVGNFAAFDLIVAIMLGEIVDGPIFGEVPLLQGLLVVAVLGGLHWGNSYWSFRHETYARLVDGTSAVLVREGTIDRDGLAKEHVSESELRALLRLKDVEDLADVAEARLEIDGELSVTPTDSARRATRGDLRRLRRQP